jgi:hypothetical protein
MNLSKGIKITVVSPAATAATTAIDSSILDMSGYEGVMFIALTGDVTAASDLTLTVKGNSANHLTVPAPITQAATTLFAAGAADADSKALMVDVYKPALRYVFANLTRATQNAVIGGIIAIQYEAKTKPTTQDASVIASKFGLGVLA